jgi:hypothetical protein
MAVDFCHRTLLRRLAIGLRIVRCSGLEVDALGFPLVLDYTFDELSAVVTADGFDDWGYRVVYALIL